MVLRIRLPPPCFRPPVTRQNLSCGRSTQQLEFDNFFHARSLPEPVIGMLQTLNHAIRLAT